MSEPGAWREGDPDTSMDAAQSVDASRLEALTVETIATQSPDKYPVGMTSEEVAEVAGVALQSITPRFAPLQRKGILVNSGLKRPGSSGRSRIVWALAGEVEKKQAA